MWNFKLRYRISGVTCHYRYKASLKIEKGSSQILRYVPNSLFTLYTRSLRKKVHRTKKGSILVSENLLWMSATFDSIVSMGNRILTTDVETTPKRRKKNQLYETKLKR